MFEKESGGRLTKQDIIDYPVLSWLCDNPKDRPFEQIKPLGRNAQRDAPATCTLQQPRYIIFRQLEKLVSRDFLDSLEWREGLMQLACSLVQTLVDNHLYKADPLDTRRGCSLLLKTKK